MWAPLVRVPDAKAASPASHYGRCEGATGTAAGAHVRHINWAVKWTGTPAERPGALRGRLFGEKVRCEELIFFFFF